MVNDFFEIVFSPKGICLYLCTEVRSFTQIYDKKESLAYIADKVISTKSSFIRPYPIAKPELYKKSLQRYIDLNIKRYLLAHHKEHQIDREVLTRLIDGSPRDPRLHRNSLV